MQTVLVATDLSPAAEPAIDRAAAVSRTMGADLRLIHVLSELLPPLVAGARRQRAQRALLHRTQSLGRRAGCRVSYDVTYGDTAARIARDSETLGAVLTVVGHCSDRARPRRWLGTTAERSLREIPNAVLIVRDRSPGEVPYRRALLAPDNGTQAGALMRYLCHLAPEAKLHCVELPVLTNGRKPVRVAADYVSAMRRALGADLLVIGMPRDETLNPFRFRRLLTPLVRMPECDTLIVPQDCAVMPMEAPARGWIRAAS